MKIFVTFLLLNFSKGQSPSDFYTVFPKHPSIFLPKDQQRILARTKSVNYTEIFTELVQKTPIFKKNLEWLEGKGWA